MLKIDNFEVMGWEHVIRGMRNPMNSWEKSDSIFISDGEYRDISGNIGPYNGTVTDTETFFELGPNDHDLMMRLRNAGTDHRKFMRMITVYLDITAPLYWWKEFDTYKVGTVANSCSTMHKIAEKEFTLDDFSHEHLYLESLTLGLEPVIDILNKYRELYLQWKNCGEDKKRIWWQMIQLLPSSYNQKRTVMLNYEVLANIYKSRKDHKLDEWHTFCHWIEELPHSEIIIGGYLDEEKPDLSKIPICNEIMEEAKRRLVEEYNKGFNAVEEDISHLVDITCSWQEELLGGRRLYELGVGYTEDDLNDREKELLRFSKEWFEACDKE